MRRSRTVSNYERQQQLERYILKNQRVSINQLCEAFAVSLATVRRDLDALAREGKIQRIHGGAVALHSAPPELPINLRAAEQADAKRRIGRAAAALVRDGESIFLGSGTTVPEVARNLYERRGITVITNSLPVMNLLAAQPHIGLVCVGGVLRPTELSFIGHIAEQALAELRVDKVIMGIHAIHLKAGLMNDYLPETQTDRAIVGIGQQVIIVADHTKCSRMSTTFVAALSAMHTLVTDTETPESFVSELQQQGIQVIRA